MQGSPAQAVQGMLEGNLTAWLSPPWLAVHSTEHQCVTVSPSHVLTAGCSKNPSFLLPGVGLRVGRCPDWCSRFGAIPVKGIPESLALHSYFKQWETCWGCASPRNTTWVPCALLCMWAHHHLRV